MGHVAQSKDLAVAYEPQGAVHVTHLRDPNADVLDDSRGRAEVNDVSDAKLILADHQDAVKHVAHDVLRAKTKTGTHGRRDQGERGGRVGNGGIEDQQQGDRDDKRRHAVGENTSQRARTLNEPNRRQW